MAFIDRETSKTIIDIKNLLNILYDESPDFEISDDNNHLIQFNNGLAQAKEENLSELSLSAIRVAGLFQAVAWIASIANGFTKQQIHLIDTLQENYDGKNMYFGKGRGRQEAENNESAYQTLYKGVIINDRAPLKNNHFLTSPATRAQTQRVPTHTVP